MNLMPTFRIIQPSLKHTALLTLVLVLTACGGKKTTNKEQSVAAGQEQPVVDITRPPEVAKNTRKADQATNPDETVSFEEWKQQQAAESGDELEGDKE